MPGRGHAHLHVRQGRRRADRRRHERAAERPLGQERRVDPMRWHASLALGILLVTGCTPLPAQLKPYPGIEQQVLDYYNRQLINEGPDCLETEMQGISALHVLRDTPHHVVVSVQYFFQSNDYDEHSGTGCAAGLCGSEHGRLVKAAEGRGIIGGRAPLTGITLVLEPPWCRSPTCSPPWTGSPTRAAARDGATRWPTCCCSRCWPSSRAPPPTAASWCSSPCIASA